MIVEAANGGALEAQKARIDSVTNECYSLIERLRDLTTEERDHSDIQQCLKRILSFQRKATDHGRERRETFKKVVERVAQVIKQRQPQLNGPLFASFHIVSSGSPGPTALSTFEHLAHRSATEERLLALVLSHIVDKETEDRKLAKVVLGNWASDSNISPKRARDIEAVGRFCFELLGAAEGDGDASIDPVGFGLLAIIPQSGIVLRALVNDGQKLLNACKGIPGCIDRARELSPIVYAGIWKLADSMDLVIPPCSRLGRLLAAYEHSASSCHTDQRTPVSITECGHMDTQSANIETALASPLAIQQPTGRQNPYRPTIPQTPTLPKVLSVPEALCRNIKAYFQDRCRNMSFDECGTLLSLDGAPWTNDLCNDLDSYCFTATMLYNKGLLNEFRCALSNAFALVGSILRIEHPRTLTCFFEVIVHLVQFGLPDVAHYLRGYIREMSATVNKENYLWCQICSALGDLDSELLIQAIQSGWKCTTDGFDTELGSTTRLSVSVRLDYIKRTSTLCSEEERLLRALLTQCTDLVHSTPRVMLNLAHNLNKQHRYDEAADLAREVMTLLCGNELYIGRIAEVLEARKVISCSQLNSGKTLEAEETMRQLIKGIVQAWGTTHPWFLEFVSVLEGWLRSWGREEDADKLQQEIQNLVIEDGWVT